MIRRDHLGPHWNGLKRAVGDFLIRHYCLGSRPPGRWPAHALPHNFYELLIISIKFVVIPKRRNAGIGNLIKTSSVRVKISNDLRHGDHVTNSNDKASVAMRDFFFRPAYVRYNRNASLSHAFKHRNRHPFKL